MKKVKNPKTVADYHSNKMVDSYLNEQNAAAATPSPLPAPSPVEMLDKSGEGFTPGEWYVLSNMVKAKWNEPDGSHDSAIICELKYKIDQEANARLICQSKAMYRALKEVNPLLDELIHITPSGEKRNELCDLNIQVKTILHTINKQGLK